MALNLKISGDETFAYAESDIRVNVHDPTRIIAAANALVPVLQHGQGQFYSLDGGATWNQTELPIVPGDEFHSDPCVDWTTEDVNGDMVHTAWALTLGATIMSPPELSTTRLRCYKSTDSGTTWTHDSDVSSDMHADKPMMWIDNAVSSPFRNRMYVIWKNQTDVFVSRRSTLSGSWQSKKLNDFETLGDGTGADIKTNSQGNVFAFWVDPGFDQPEGEPPQVLNIYFRKSTNGGVDFDPVQIISRVHGKHKISVPAFRKGALIYVSAGAYRTANQNMVYAVWTDLTGPCATPNGPGSNVTSACKTRIWFRRSTNGGTDWDPPMMLSPDNALSDQFNPKLAVDETNGQIAVMYYDTISDNSRHKSDVWMKTSKDGGAQWSEAFRITSAPTDETLDSADTNQYGDYTGMSGHNKTFFPCWTDRRRGLREEIWTSPLTIGPDDVPISVPRTSLHLFIKPPYTDWSIVHRYGPDSTSIEPLTHHDTRLETELQGSVYAAITGQLCIRRPGTTPVDPNLPLPDPSTFEIPPVAVSLFLEPLPQAISDDFRELAKGLGGLSGFIYDNIDLPSLGAALEEDLAKKGPVTVGSPRKASELIYELMFGLRGLSVSGGQMLGQAAVIPPFVDKRQIGFGVLNDSAATDPSRVYSMLQDFVDDGPIAVQQYVNRSSSQWPLFATDATVQELLGATSQKLFSMAVLDTLRPGQHQSVTPSVWRQIGDGQKDLWLARLRTRVGHSLPGETALRYEFDLIDAQNIFQIEALVEFYANFPDPWKAGGPVNPGAPGYGRVDFLDPSGLLAMAVGQGTNDVTLHPIGDQTAADIRKMLDDTIEYTNIANNGPKIYDLLILGTDASDTRKDNTYQIVDIDPSDPRLTLDRVPVIAPAGVRWTIRRRPVLVVVDSIGGRSAFRFGNAAAVEEGDDSLVNLDTSPNLSRVNPGFDTVFLSSITSVPPAQPKYAYRIQTVDDMAHTVRVLGTPTLAGASPWQIPSGVGGRARDVDRPEKRVAPDGGFDNYDGALFVVYRSAVHASPFLSWTSFTSWESLRESDGYPGASIRGNASKNTASGKCAAYAFNSHRSNNEKDRRFLNFCFRVTDIEPPYMSSDDLRDADLVTQSRFYFRFPAEINASGQTGVRLQAGQGSVRGVSRFDYGSASQGGPASFSFQSLRRTLISILIAEANDLEATFPSEFEELKDKLTPQKSRDYYVKQKLQTGWDNAVVGQLWIIRPDEPPDA